MSSPEPVDLDDPRRLAAIAQLPLRGHLADADLDAIVATVADACDVPIVVINIVTPGLQTYPAEVGVGAPCTQVPDALSFCAEVVRTGQPFVVPDAREDLVYASNPLVVAGAIRSYAGEPLVYDGHVIGALSMFDSEPRTFTRAEVQVLRAQARLASAVFRLRAMGQKGARVTAKTGVDELRKALDQEQLVVHYHPIVQLSPERVIGVEALVRWQHPERGLVMPLQFIPQAEESGLIVELGEWVLRTAAQQATDWAAAGRPLDVAVNLSPAQMREPGFVDRFRGVLAEVAAPLEHITLEVTESALLDQPDAAESLARLSQAGIRLALDDFGTGYSSFSYLRRFPIDVIKIDRSFVAGLGRHPDDDAIVASVVGLAHNTGKSVVAEGVESNEHLTILRRWGVHAAQGFLWTQPLPVAELEPWIDSLEVADLSGVGATGPVSSGLFGPHDPRILQMHSGGASVHTIASALNREGLRTYVGSRWHARSVAQVIATRERSP